MASKTPKRFNFNVFREPAFCFEEKKKGSFRRRAYPRPGGQVVEACRAVYVIGIPSTLVSQKENGS